MVERRVSVRGTSDGLVIELGAGSLESVLKELDERLGRAANFFRGGRVALKVGNRLLNRNEIEAIGGILHKWDVTLWAVDADALETRAAADSLGLETDLGAAQRWAIDEAPASTEASWPSANAASEGLLVRRTLRSGASLVHRGHLVIIGDVNPGAEVIAGGDIVVWGKLRGVAHAGAAGDETAVVCALRLIPSQIRIGYRVLARPAEPRGIYHTPHIAIVRGDEISIVPWVDMAMSEEPLTRGAIGRFLQRLGLPRRKS